MRSGASKKRGDIIRASTALKLLDYESQQEHAGDEEKDYAAQLHSLSWLTAFASIASGAGVRGTPSTQSAIAKAQLRQITMCRMLES
jgi:hypothetical protein